MSKNDGGPAFCHKVASEDANGRPLRTYETEIDNGMSLRDWFAGQALLRLKYDVVRPYAETAAEAYRMADAMIAERNK